MNSAGRLLDSTVEESCNLLATTATRLERRNYPWQFADLTNAQKATVNDRDVELKQNV